MNRILITGVAGFIGSKIARSMTNQNIDIIGVDDLSNGFQRNIPKNVEFLELDLSDTNSYNKLPKSVDTIMHLAGQSSGEISFDNPKLDLEKNTISTLNLINYGIKAKANRIVHASSMSVYGQVNTNPISEDYYPKPISCYGISKLSSELYLETFKNDLPFICLRMFNVYGPGQDMSNLRQGMVSIYLSQAINSRKIEVKGSLKRFRDFIYIDDVVNIWKQSIYSDLPLNQKINIATGKKIEVETLLKKICELVPGSNYYESNNTPGDQNGIYADINKMKKYFKFNELTTLEEGLKLFAESFNNNIS